MANSSNVPLTQQVEAYKLEAAGVRELFKLQLRDMGSTVLYLSPKETVTWADQQWDEWPCTIAGFAQNTNGEKSRPKFTVANPEGVFSLWVGQGAVDGAVLSHYEVQQAEIESGALVYTKRIWTISRTVSLNKNMVVFECRSIFDGQQFKIPARAFYPPEYPHVTLR